MVGAAIRQTGWVRFSGCLKAWLCGAVFGVGCVAAAQAADLQTWPQGKPAALAQVAQPVRVINVWATWCAPCRREMPMLSRWYRAHGYGQKTSPVQLIGVALNRSEELNRFTREVKVVYPLWRYAGNDSRLWMQQLGNSVGALPFTVVDAPKCGFRQVLLGEVKTQQLDALVQQALRQCAAKKVR